MEMVADISEAVALEDAMQVMVDLHRKGDKQAVQKQIAVALSCVSRLNQKHDTVLASYRDQLDLVAAVKSEYRDASMRLDEHRYTFYSYKFSTVELNLAVLVSSTLLVLLLLHVRCLG